MRILGVVEYGAGSAAEAVAGHARRRAVPRGRHLLTATGFYRNSRGIAPMSPTRHGSPQRRGGS